MYKHLKQCGNIMEDIKQNNEKNTNPENTDIKEMETFIKTLQEKHDALVANYEKFQQQVLYTKADNDNIRRNAAREILESSEKATIKILTQLLPIIDDFERCLEIEKNEGIDAIYKSMIKFLNANGVTVVTTSIEFNPECHEGIGNIPVIEGKNPGEIVSVARKGYKYKDTLIRPALVTVYE
jgi:molecular chaperone GrpE